MEKHEIEFLNPDDEGRNLFHRALLEGNSDTVKQYLKLGIDIKIKDTKCERNCIGWAAKGGNLQCLKLLKQYADPSDWKSFFSEPDKFNNLPIHLAAINHDDVELFEFIHKEGNYTLLEIGQINSGLYHHVFLLKNNQKIFEYINKNLSVYEKKYLLSLRTTEGAPPISWYIFKNRLDGIKAIMSLAESDVNQPGFSYYCSPLIIAAQAGNLEAITLLLKYNADLAFQDLRNITPLMSAIKCKSYKAAILLLKNGADINQVLFEDNTLLHLQLKHNEDDMEGLIFLLNHGAHNSIFKEDMYGFRPIEWLSCDLDSYLNRLNEIDPSIKSQLECSFRKKAKKVNGNVVNELLVDKYPNIKEFIDGGTCNAFGFLAAFNYFNNGFSLDSFYNDLEKVINLSVCPDKSQLDYLEQWANDIVWLQSSVEMKKMVFIKPLAKKNVAPRYYDFFSQRDRKKVLSFIKDRPIYGPVKTISYFFQCEYDGRHWISTQLESALKKRSLESEYLEIISEHHLSVLLTKGDKFIFVDVSTDNQITKMLNIKEVVNLLIFYHYLPHLHSDYYYDLVFPFHIRSWNLCKPISQNENEYEAELKKELLEYIKNHEIYEHFTPQKHHLLHFCASMDDVISMKALLNMNKNLDVNISHPDEKISPLHFAVGNDSFNCVKFLLENNDVEIFCKNKSGEWMLATAYQNEKMITFVLKCLSKRGILPEDLVKEDFNFRFFAMLGGDNELIEKLFTPDECKQYLPQFN